MTLQSGIHPYPAMLHEPTLLSLAEKYIAPGSSLLDPFCGTGRSLVVAALRGASATGVDINPLACLIANAKVDRVRREHLLRLSQKFDDSASAPLLDLEPNRLVRWYSGRVRADICRLISWINNAPLWRAERRLLAVVLSATVRDVSFCRNDQWKLHRMTSEARKRFHPNVFGTFQRRLLSCLRDPMLSKIEAGACVAIHGDSRRIRDAVGAQTYNLLLSSPPYGDSRTTVQYGAVSGLCLAAVRHITDLHSIYEAGSAIDRKCLGGQVREVSPVGETYWSGSAQSEAGRRLACFFQDLDVAIRSSCKALSQRSRTVFVVGNRRICNTAVRLDQFVIDTLASEGFGLERRTVRPVSQKWTPFRINRYGGRKAATKRTCSAPTPTMCEEYIIVCQRK